MSDPATSTSYDESVGSCGPPTPTTVPPPPPATASAAPVRRQLNFATGGGDLENDGDEDDEFLCRAADDIERGYNEAKLRAPPCICGRGVCAVERDGQSGRKKYVCPSRPKCNHVSFCEEVDLNLKSQPTSRSHPEPINPCALNDPSNHMADPRTPDTIRTQVTGTTTPVSVRSHVAGATTLFSDCPQGAGVTTLVNAGRHGGGATPPANDSPKGVGSKTPAKFIPRGAKSNEGPVCQCTAGKCTKSRIGGEEWYVCPIPKGKGACSYRMLVRDVPSSQTTPCDEVHQESPSMLHRPIVAVNTPSKSPNSKDVCFRGKERGHWMRDCPKQPPRNSPCFKCGMAGHWKSNCPQL